MTFARRVSFIFAYFVGVAGVCAVCRAESGGDFDSKSNVDRPVDARSIADVGIGSQENAGVIGACCNPESTCIAVEGNFCTFEVLGVYFGDGTSCENASCAVRCDSGCAACWVGSIVQNNCPPVWRGDGICDCGCQFVDPDCGPTGACCLANNESNACRTLTEETCVESFGGAFQGVGVECSSVDCQRCNPVCDWCWSQTMGELDCPVEFDGDGRCDCGCQFADSDCPTCGDAVCDTSRGENATWCDSDCEDLLDIAGLQACFGMSGVACAGYDFEEPDGVGPEDVEWALLRLSGP